jgi:inhibitor of KinA
MEISALGDSTLIVRVNASLEETPDACLDAVLATKSSLDAAKIPGVVELAPAYTTVALFYDPARVIAAGAQPEAVFDWLAERVHRALSAGTRIGAAQIEVRRIDIPVCYEKEFGFDLEEVAHQAGIHWKEVIDLHCSVEYRVNCVGFTPGFPFLSGLPAKLATPRRSTPRKEIPAGSVAIGGRQTGVYPVKSPGGWNVIGRTPLRLFDPNKNPPALLRSGDRVRFRAIAREEFEGSKK